jgi:hypothetical protein
MYFKKMNKKSIEIKRGIFMYKCNCCGAIFYETSTKEEEPDCVSAPFGIGTVRMGGGTFSCCPECEGDDYEEMYFNGVDCPYCGEEIKLSDIEDEKNCEFTCENCKTEFIIKKGEVEDAYQK